MPASPHQNIEFEKLLSYTKLVMGDHPEKKDEACREFHDSLNKIIESNKLKKTIAFCKEEKWLSVDDYRALKLVNFIMALPSSSDFASEFFFDKNIVSLKKEVFSFCRAAIEKKEKNIIYSFPISCKNQLKKACYDNDPCLLEFILFCIPETHRPAFVNLSYPQQDDVYPEQLHEKAPYIKLFECILDREIKGNAIQDRIKKRFMIRMLLQAGLNPWLKSHKSQQSLVERLLSENYKDYELILDCVFADKIQSLKNIFIFRSRDVINLTYILLNSILNWVKAIIFGDTNYSPLLGHHKNVKAHDSLLFPKQKSAADLDIIHAKLLANETAEQSIISDGELTKFYGITLFELYAANCLSYFKEPNIDLLVTEFLKHKGTMKMSNVLELFYESRKRISFQAFFRRKEIQSLLYDFHGASPPVMFSLGEDKKKIFVYRWILSFTPDINQYSSSVFFPFFEPHQNKLYINEEYIFHSLKFINLQLEYWLNVFIKQQKNIDVRNKLIINIQKKFNELKSWQVWNEHKFKEEQLEEIQKIDQLHDNFNITMLEFFYEKKDLSSLRLVCDEQDRTFHPNLFHSTINKFNSTLMYFYDDLEKQDIYTWYLEHGEGLDQKNYMLPPPKRGRDPRDMDKILKKLSEKLSLITKSIQEHYKYEAQKSLTQNILEVFDTLKTIPKTRDDVSKEKKENFVAAIDALKNRFLKELIYAFIQKSCPFPAELLEIETLQDSLYYRDKESKQFFFRTLVDSFFFYGVVLSVVPADRHKFSYFHFQEFPEDRNDPRIKHILFNPQEFINVCRAKILEYDDRHQKNIVIDDVINRANYYILRVEASGDTEEETKENFMKGMRDFVQELQDMKVISEASSVQEWSNPQISAPRMNR